jgi:hypothetical protein
MRQAAQPAASTHGVVHPVCHHSVVHGVAIDWTSEMTAIATAALALLTAVLAIGAIIAARLTKRSIDEQLASTRSQLEASYRPLLSDIAETATEARNLDPEDEVTLAFEGGYRDRCDWRHVYVRHTGGVLRVAVPLRNVGTGLAVIDKCGVRVAGLPEPRYTLVHRPRAAPGEQTRVLCTHELDGDPTSLRLEVPYTDFTGGQATVLEVDLKGVGDLWGIVSIAARAAADLEKPAGRRRDSSSRTSSRR